MMTRLLNHVLNGVDGVDTEATLSERDCHEASTTTDFQYRGIRCQGEVVDPVEDSGMAVPVNLSIYAIIAINVLPEGRRRLEISVHLFLPLPTRGGKLFHVRYSRM